MRLPSLILVSAFSLSACNGSAPIPEDFPDASVLPDLVVVQPIPDLGDNGLPSNVYPAPFPGPPQVVSGGGPIVAHPKFVPIFFANDDTAFTAQIADFISKVGATKYWTAATSEYGVGAGTSTMPVQLMENAPASTDDNGIQTWLAGKLNANDPLFPPNDKNTIYAINYPETTSITLQGSKSCQTFGGYHTNTKLDVQHGSARVAYAVVPRCNFGMSTLDTTTGSESHELVEAATDPYPQTQPAFGQVDEDHLYWEFVLGGGETGDLCAQDQASFVQFAELPYVVQRTWSNDSAAAGKDPCQPELPGEVFFNASPELNDSIDVGGMFTVLGVQIAIGDTKTIDLDLYSEADTGGPWSVKVIDANTLQGGAATMKFQLDRTSGQNGEKLHLTITPTKMGQFGVGVFVIESRLGNAQHLQFGLVGEQ